ncbi:hypothetical protein [Hoeflea sp. TYP-13]|uniref:hypothetical protein n=1 Tax=Hoeflea sp. TYP-13 TaxID=3230023 RepID=UPI0034C64212
MELNIRHPDSVVRIKVPVVELLGRALARLRRQRAYQRVLRRGGGRVEGLVAWLVEADACLRELARPELVLKPVSATVAGSGVIIGGRVKLDDEDLARDVARGGQVSTYLLTLGFSQSEAFEALGRDYAAHHVQTDLAGEVLFELGRRSHRLQRAQSPGARLRRVQVQASDLCGGRKVWDPARVQALIGCFDDFNQGVTVTETGCFQPLNSLLGLTIRL